MTKSARAASTRKTISAPDSMSVSYSARSQSVSPSTRVTLPRSPRRSARWSALRAFHAVPRSSALPSWPGGRSSSTSASCPTRVSTVAATSGPEAIQRSRRPRSGTSATSDTTVKRHHWSHGGSARPVQASAPTTIAPMPKKRKKKPPGVRTSPPSRPRPSTTQSHHAMRAGQRIHGSRSLSNSGAPEDAQEDRERDDPEHLRANRGGGHEDVEPPGERERDREEVPVPRRQRGQDAVEDAVLPAGHPPAARLALVAPGDHAEGAGDADQQERDGWPSGPVARAGDAEGDAGENGHVDEGVTDDVEPVPEPRLGEAQACELTVGAVEDRPGLEQPDGGEHGREAGAPEQQPAGDAEHDARERDSVRRERRAEKDARQRPRQATVDQAIEVPVARILERAEERALEPGAAGLAEGPGRRPHPGAALACHVRAGSHADAGAVVLDDDHLTGTNPPLELPHEGGIDDGARPDHEPEGLVGGRRERGYVDQRAQDAAVMRRRKGSDERAALDPGALERENGPDEERLPRDGTERIARLGHDDRLADRGLGHHRRGRTWHRACSTSSGKSISVHGMPSTRSNPTSVRARSSG